MNELGQPTGFAIELLRAVAREADLTLEIRTGPWADVRRDLETGAIDVLPFMAWSAERDLQFDFGSTYVTVYESAFVRKGDRRIRSEADLQGKILLVMEGDSAHDHLKRTGIAKEIQVTKTLAHALILLKAGVGDAVICERVAGLLALKEHKLQGIEPLPHPLSWYERNFSFAVRQGNSALLSRLELGLATLRISGQYQRLYDDWYHSVDPSIAQAERRARISTATAVFFALLGALGIVGLNYLTRALDRKNRSLTEVRKTFGQILDAIPDMVLVKGPRSKIVWGNRAFREFHGMSEEQLKDLIDAPFSDPDHTLQYVRDDHWVFTNGRALDIPDEPVTRHDGMIRRFNTVKAPIFDSKGEVTSTVGVSRDITDRLEQERVIAQQRDAMASTAKMSALGEMAAEIAHEINNPLAIVAGASQQIEAMANSGMSSDQADLERLARYSTQITSTVMRIASIVKSLRAFARDGSSDQFVSESLARVVSDTLDMCRERFKNHGVHLELKIPEKLTLECRPVQISQILINLLNNAFDAVSTQKEKRIEFEVREISGLLEFRVTDNGPGIAPEIREKIMQPFFTTKGPGKGTGLGLSVSIGIAQSHGGTLTLDTSSSLTTFILRLPIRQTSAARAA